MTTYKGIKGLSLQTVAGDPGTIVDGLIWYDSIAKKVQGSKTGAGTWATGGTGNTVKNYPGGGGTQTAAWVAGGETPGSPSQSAIHEQYNGTSWAEAADLNTGRYENSGAGTQAAGLIFFGLSGSSTVDSEEWDGSSWAEGNNTNVARRAAASCGTQTAALGISGSNYPNLPTNVESYDGSSWTEGTNVNTGGYYVAGNGTTTAALISGRVVFGSPDATNFDKTESWDGSSWTDGASLNTARAYDLAAFGTSTSAIHAGGNSGPANVANSEEWDGSSWTEVGDLSTAIRYTLGAGSSTSGIQMFGYTDAKTAITQEWNVASAAVTFTSS